MPAWTNHHCQLGLGSTSRVEGAHAMVKLWLQRSTGSLLEGVRALQMEFRKQFIEIIHRISKEMIVHVKNFPPHICAAQLPAPCVCFAQVGVHLLWLPPSFPVGFHSLGVCTTPNHDSLRITLNLSQINSALITPVCGGLTSLDQLLNPSASTCPGFLPLIEPLYSHSSPETMGNFRYNSDAVCSYAPIYLFQHPDYCNLNALLLIFIFLSAYGLLLLANHLDSQSQAKIENRHTNLENLNHQNKQNSSYGESILASSRQINSNDNNLNKLKNKPLKHQSIIEPPKRFPVPLSQNSQVIIDNDQN
ncbi:hypothetical protein O181_091135 [Austropuccinia psidii MF-1]|uniref:Protein FAR1-RELATED SEQUENCE n=1 Tax=Austropuccinia psidii MF-1 TaxID=1389203 RepID=A0A9Q3P7T1_9BASI|nr:hypothetical protein [Austropuccinia psidii MF-1]